MVRLSITAGFLNSTTPAMHRARCGHLTTRWQWHALSVNAGSTGQYLAEIIRSTEAGARSHGETLAAFDSPVFRVLLDLLDQKQVRLGSLDLEKAAARYTLSVAEARHP
jgi:hypothetical protein